MSTLTFDAVTKRYGEKAAVAELSFQVRDGDRVAVLGRNGAGKTTLIRLALGLARPTSGSCRMFGRHPDHQEVRRRVGYAPQMNAVPERLRVRELIRFVCEVRHAAEPVELIDRLEVASFLPELSGGLSLGQRRRLTLLLAFIGDPELVVLDEPTANLDGAARQAVWDLVGDFCRDGGTLLLASHDYREVANLTDRVLVFADGRLRADSTVTELARSTGVIALEGPRGLDAPMDGISYVIRQPDRTVLLTRQPEAVLERLAVGGDSPALVQRRATVEEVCLALGSSRRA